MVTALDRACAGGPPSKLPLRSRLTRVLGEGRAFIPVVDGLRLVAISVVVLHHIGGWVDARVPHVNGPLDGSVRWLLGQGHFGVQLFFVISGFLLALPFARTRLHGAPARPLGAYYLRRLTRLEPPYVLSLLLLASAAAATGARSADEGVVAHALAALLYQHGTIYAGPLPFNPVAWSLEVEVQFYLLTPALSYVFAIRQTLARRLVLVAVVLTGGALAMAFSSSPRWSLSLLGQIEFFAAGFLLADVYLTEWRGDPSPQPAWDLASVIGWTGLLGAAAIPLLAPVTMPLLVLLAYAGAMRGSRSRRLFSRPWAVAIGGMCYSMYLLHYPLISFVGRLAPALLEGPSYAAACVAYAAALLPVIVSVTLVYFVFVERPCMNPGWASALARRVRLLVGRDPAAGASGAS
jgi:peptidoglycan/LPS O-acetylase OafA/YrhL